MNIETNKIAGAVFGSLLFVVGVNIIAGGLFAPQKPAVPGYDLPAPEEARSRRRALRRPRPSLCRCSSPRPIRPRASPPPRSAPPATPSRRAAPNKVGPNLYGVDRPPRRLACGLQLLGGPEGQGRRVVLRGAQRLRPSIPRATPPAPSWPSRASPGLRSAPTSWPICAPCPTARPRCRPPSKATGHPVFHEAGPRPGFSFAASCFGPLPCTRPIQDKNVTCLKDASIRRRRVIRSLLLSLLAACLCLSPVAAQEAPWRHGAALLGEPKYPAGLQAFRLRQPERAEGRPGPPRRAGHLRQLQHRRRRREGHARAGHRPHLRDPDHALPRRAERCLRPPGRSASLSGGFLLRRPSAFARRRAGTTASR